MQGSQPEYYKQIFGWFDFAEVYDKAVDEARDGAVFVEVGSFLGKSACYLAERIRMSGKNITVFCVDHFRMGESEQQFKEMKEYLASIGGTFIMQFLQNITPFRDLIIPITTNSVAAANYFPDRTVDFIFIDASHDEDSVRSDIAVWAPKLLPGGMIAGHDYDMAAVRKVVDETYPNRKLMWRCWLARDFDELIIFANWYRSRANAVPIAPADSIRKVGPFTGLTLFREGPYQVQLWIGEGNAGVAEHNHPGVDTIQIYLSGQIYLKINGLPITTPDMMGVNGNGASLLNGQSVRILPTDKHSFELGPLGGSWMTIEKWLNGKPTSTELDWEGAPIDEEHKLSIVR